MYGRYVRSIDRQLIGGEDTFLWLSKTDLKAKTESETKAAQDHDLLISFNKITVKATIQEIHTTSKTWRDKETKWIWISNIGRRTIHKETL